jgi:phosphoribosylaminoimidazolecarboxamide formyltransferase/IMP cyclohydrolase
MSNTVPSQDSLTPSEPGEVRVGRALLSVSDKTGIVAFAQGLAELGIEIVSTGGTAAALAEAGLTVRTITDLTGFPEIMDGRVKTLHPKLYAGLLAVRSDPAHVAAAREHTVEPVDLVCVNLYPFEQTAARPDVSEAEVIENIDIGGPTMIRAAAKNAAFAAPVVAPARYDSVLSELRSSGGRLSLATREALAAEAFAYTARYDAAISRWFQRGEEGFAPLVVRAYERVLELPYGENPHQAAAYYAEAGARSHILSRVAQLGGKPLSFNNLLDIDAARALLDEFDGPACVIVKHNNPCGVGTGSGILEAYRRAFACDPISAFGGIVCLNRAVEEELARELTGQFIEVLFASGFSEAAREVLASKPNMRILDDQERRQVPLVDPVFRQVRGGLLMQERDLVSETRPEMRVASARQPTDSEWRAMEFAWKVCKHIKSNAIVLADEHATLGIGAGQMSRVDAVRIAVEKAQASLAGAVMASDAFFPFPDGVQLGLDAGISAVVQPGGSMRDGLSIEAVDAAGAAMVFTGRRHFRH